MKNKGLKIFIAIMVLIIIVIGIVGFKFYNDGFKFYTYSTENHITEQIIDIIATEDETEETMDIEILGLEDYGNKYYGLYLVKEEDGNQCIIGDYTKKYDLGKQKVFNLNKIIKSNNSVSMVEIENGGKFEYLMLLCTENEEFESLNVVSTQDNEIIDNVVFSNEELLEVGAEELKDDVYLVKYSAENGQKITIELVRKSEG